MAPPRTKIRRRWRRDVRVPFLYAATLVRDFRWTLFLLALAVAAGTALFATTPHPNLPDGVPLQHAVLAAWLALFAQLVYSPPASGPIAVLVALYPLLGFGLIGEGIVRIGMLIMSKKRGDKEWTIVQASTYRNHIILCGLGNLGFRTLQQLLAEGAEVVALEKNSAARFITQAHETGTPVLIRDMKEDQALIDAGVSHAKVIVIATNDDLANLEVALDARRMNPKIRVVMRMFDQQIADKLKTAGLIDEAFSSTALAAPAVAAIALMQLGSGTKK